MKKIITLFVLSLICSAAVKAEDRLMLKTATTFLFNQYYPNETILQNEAGTATSMNFGLGLYLACQGNSSAGARTYKTELKNIQTITLSDNCTAEGDADVFDKGSYIGVSTNATGVARYNTAPSTGNMYSSFGFRTEIAGTVYALVKGTFKDSESRQVVLIDCTANDDKACKTLDAVTPADGSTYYMLKATTVAKGIYQIHSTIGGGCTVYAIKFVPDSDNKDRHSYTVNLTNGMATFSSANNCSVPEGCKAYKVKTVNSNNVEMESIADIPANTGVIIKADDPTTTSVEIKSIANASKKSSLLTANVASYALPATYTVSSKNYTNYILVKDGNNIVFAPSTGTGSVGANKAYLRIEKASSESGAKSLNINFDGDNTTGIATISLPMGDRGLGEAFNLLGQKVSGASKGIVVKNGRKYLIK